MAGAGRRRVVIGIGNPDRGDDAVGRRIAQSLQGSLPADVEIIEQDGEATSLIACMEGASAAYLIDACASAAPVGTVQRFDVAESPLPQDAFNLSTHGFGLVEAIELARALGQLPDRCVVYAVEAGSVTAGTPLSPAVAASVGAVGARVRAELMGVDAAEGGSDA